MHRNKDVILGEDGYTNCCDNAPRNIFSLTGFVLKILKSVAPFNQPAAIEALSGSDRNRRNPAVLRFLLNDPGTRSRRWSNNTCGPSSDVPATPAPQAIGIDEIAVRKGHSYRIVVSDLVRKRPIWFGGTDRSEASMAAFYNWLGRKKSRKIRLAVMDMWRPFRTVAQARVPQAAILFDKFHVDARHLGEALDAVRKSEYARLSGKDRRYIKGQKYTLLSRRENLTLEGRQALKMLLRANKRLNTAYLLKESFGQLWGYQREGFARRFFENWRAALKWQRLQPYEKFADMIDRHWDGIAAYCKPENKVSLGFVEGCNNKIRVFQRRAYGLRDQEYLRLKVLTCMLPPL